MYSFYKVIGKFAKGLSNGFFLLSLPISIILCGISWCMFFIKDIIIKITNEPELFILNADGSNKGFIDSMEIIKWVGLGVAIFIIVCWLVLFIAWLLRKVLFKKIADNYITRNKEWRNRDINRTLEKLENYRFRD